MSDERGTSLFEVVIIGFAVVMMVLPAISTVARLTESNATVHAVARDSALWVARHGGDPPHIDDVEIQVTVSGDSVEVTATQDVLLIGVGGAEISRTVVSKVEVPVSIYRSRP